MTDIDFCLSSYIAFRYLWKDGVDFAEGFQHKNILPIDDNQRIPVKTSQDIDREIQKQIDALYSKYDNIGILLSGGMDSANLASYLKPGSHGHFGILSYQGEGRPLRHKRLSDRPDLGQWPCGRRLRQDVVQSEQEVQRTRLPAGRRVRHRLERLVHGKGRQRERRNA